MDNRRELEEAEKIMDDEGNLTILTKYNRVTIIDIHANFFIVLIKV